jgi:hypothetical protein
MNSAASSMIPQLDGGLKGNAVLYQSSCHVRMPAVFKNQWGKNDAPDYTASPARVSGVSAIYFTLARRALTDGVFHHEPTNMQVPMGPDWKPDPFLQSAALRSQKCSPETFFDAPSLSPLRRPCTRLPIP